MSANRLPVDELKRLAMNSAERLAFFIQERAPDELVGRQWVILWKRMTEAYGEEFYEKWQTAVDKLTGELDDEDRSN